MKRLALLLCPRRGGDVSSILFPPAVIEAQLPIAAAQLCHLCNTPTCPPSEIAKRAAELLPSIAKGEVGLHQQLQVLSSLASRAIRNENVMLQCLWNVFKAPLRSTAILAAEMADTSGANASLSLPELAAYTARAFRVMGEQRFLNDPQMLAVALGRCVELAPHATLAGICNVYAGLSAMDRTFFSMAEVSHYRSELTEQLTKMEVHELTDTPDEETLRHQPNLVDVLCGELELHLRRCAVSLMEEGPVHPRGGGSSQRDLCVPSVSFAFATNADETEREWFLQVLKALAVVGVVHADTLNTLCALAVRYRETSSMAFFISALTYASHIAERVIDPASFEESVSVRDARRNLTMRLSEEIQRGRGVKDYLRHHPQELLMLRRLFEREAADSSLSPALWDTVRCVRVAHRHTLTAHQASRRPSGKLFEQRYSVKVKPISVDISEAERFVPPEFKTWRSPTATARGGHLKKRGAPRQVAFGTRRISKNYVQEKRKKFCPSRA